MTAFSSISRSNLDLLTTDIQRTLQSHYRLPQTQPLRCCLETIRQMQCNLAPPYTEHFWKPAFRFLSSPLAQKNVAFTESVAQAVIQHSTNFGSSSTRALQQFVCDMWNTFVTNSGYCSTGHCLSPIVVWSDDDQGPYALCQHPVQIQKQNAVPIVSFPSGFMKSGILGWTILAHETAHTILESGLKLSSKLQEKVAEELDKNVQDGTMSQELKEYWVNRISESAADVMSVLYMGPIAALGLICFLRAANKNGHLSNYRTPKDHPADILRGILVACVVRNLDLTTNNEWFGFLLRNIYEDFDSSILMIDFEIAVQTTMRVARALMNVQVLHRQSLANIRSWNNSDEDQVAQYLRSTHGSTQHAAFTPSFKAPHLIIAANKYLLDNGASKVTETFNKMIELLNKESRRQASDCTTCPLSQKNIYQYCPAPSQPIVEKKDTKQDNTDLVIGLVAGILAGGALLGLGLDLLLNRPSKPRRRFG